MAVRVVLRHEHAHVGARLAGVVRGLAGAVLLGLGVLVGPFGLFFLAGYVAELLAQVTGDTVPGEPGVFDEVPYPTSTIVVAAAAATVLLVLGLTVGLRLLRSGRTIVLFLRRFRDAEAIGALSAAAAGTVGSSWRVVTLDDGHITAQGVAPGTRRLLRGLRRLYRLAVALPTRLIPLGSGLFLAAAAVVGLRYLQTGAWDLDLVTRTLPGDDAFLGWLPPPPQPLGADLETLFYLLVAGGIVAVALGLAGFVATMATLPLLGPVVLASSAADAADSSEAARRATVRGDDDLARATAAVVTGSRRVLAPRLVVLEVADGMWRQSVRGLAAVSAATVVDVSEPSENVLWEVERLRAARARLVAVGHLPELGALVRAGEAAAPERAGGDPADPARHPAGGDPGGGVPGDEGMRRLAEVLDGEVVLAYTLGWWGRRRFTRALRSTLLCDERASS